MRSTSALHSNLCIFEVTVKKKNFMKSTFSKQNYILLLVGLCLIGLGYVLMIGGGSDDPEVFNPAIFDFQRISLAPMTCLAGFVTILFAIMWRPKLKEETTK